jgi:hypothetical protein
MTTTNSEAEFSREESIAIGAPPETVFHYIADLRRHSEWGRSPGILHPCPAQSAAQGPPLLPLPR